MAQERKLAVSAINVRITDPAKREYDALFRSILRQRFPVKVYNNDYLILTAFGKFESTRMSWLGVVGRFTDIPDDADWLDTSTLKEADEDDKSRIVIPDNLKPNYEAFYCGLFPKEHIFVFETFSESERLSPRHVLKWLRAATKTKRSLERFGPVEVDLIPDYDILEKILGSDTIRQLEIVIRKPNPDQYTAEQFKAAENRLAELNAREELLAYKAEEDEYLELNEQTEALAKVGAENGKVRARLREDGAMKTVSTDDRPIEEHEMFDPDDVSPTVKFASIALKLLGRIKINRG